MRSRRRRSAARLSLSRRNARQIPTAQRVRTFYRLFRRLLRWFGPAVVAAGLFLICAYGWEAFSNSKQFTLQQLQYPKASEKTLPKEMLMQYAGLKLGQNLLKLDLQALAQKLLRHPRIATVQLQRKLPGRLVVKLTFHKPVAIAMLGAPYYLDKQGRPFARVQDLKHAPKLLHITGIQRIDYQRDPVQAQQRFQHALTLAKLYRQRRLHQYQPLKEIQHDPVLGYILRTHAGNVYLGEGHLSKKIQQLHRIYRLFWQRGVRKLRYVYLDHPRHPRRAIVRLDDAVMVTPSTTPQRKLQARHNPLTREVLPQKPRVVQASMREHL